MTNRFLIYTSTISYVLYLLHKFPHEAFKISPFFEAYTHVIFWNSLILSYVLAFTSWKLLEQPFSRLKRFFLQPHRPRIHLRCRPLLRGPPTANTDSQSYSPPSETQVLSCALFSIASQSDISSCPVSNVGKLRGACRSPAST